MEDLTLSFEELETLTKAAGVAKFCNPDKPRDLGKLCKKLADKLEKMRKNNMSEINIKVEHPFSHPRIMPWLQKSFE